MRDFNRTLSRLKKTFMPRKGKKGSSLAFVMAIGAALVIWVTCIMPLMTTTGTVAAQTQVKQANYLENRSAIEFCKSELEDIIRTRMPYTFAVIEKDDGTYYAVERNDTSIDINEYPTKINAQSDHDKDTPKTNDVVAICAVMESVGGNYLIKISTWNNCEKGLTYSVSFAPDGNLLIFPEAYGDKQALPLSDFVAVDGQLGSHHLWDSTITISNAGNIGNIKENLLAWIMPSSDDWTPRRANSAEYPAVFKATAEAAAHKCFNNKFTTFYLCIFIF